MITPIKATTYALMTITFEIEKRCAVCGKVSKQIALMSTNAIGYSDLDMRPPEMERSTINTWIQICPSCGYRALDISELIEKSSEAVNSDFINNS